MEKLKNAEERALAATELEAFPIQLYEIRRTVKSILDLFGRSNIFAEYTVHDFSHVEKMLDDLEWIIPAESKSRMTPADWLLIVLSIYFHDLGLIVTEDEFSNRDKAAFQEFCNNVLFASTDGKDYQIKVETLGQDKAERFFYQEFVRYNHAKRVRAWIEGTPSDALGYAKAQREELARLFAHIDPDFRRDLAIVCESHNLDDLDDLGKYKIFKPYGQRSEESANILYAAVILRTTDLLQITRQRAPSVMFRMINATDPISQVEWAKQNAVKAVIPKPASDKSGQVNSSIQSDTISVYAKYDNENGFFGLTSYLAYADKQLKYAFGCVQKSKAQTANWLDFPWKGIDDSQVEAVGFIPRPFEFQIDQAKILDLLTGHTLYNDSSVAIRELVQNSIDAVRLQCDLQKVDSFSHGRISIHWNSAELTLTITDNGTGMTQDIIERHLLSVGSSRYQDAKFKEQNPTFSPISRFGIGVLSAFMVADNVQIATFHDEQTEGRQISLRSVHGKYLIRLLDRHCSEAREIGRHGTKIVLKMRASAKRVNVMDTLQRWIVFPRCHVQLTIDGSPPQLVGYRSPRSALEKYLSTAQHGFKPEQIEVHEKRIRGITLAFATFYSSHFRDRNFLQNNESYHQRGKPTPPVGVCVEGIRVEFQSPGFPGRTGLLAIADCHGNDAPKTNVARSALESEADQSNIASAAFELYLDQVRNEVKRLQEEEGFTLAYSIEQFPFIAGPLYSHTDKVTEAFRHFPMYMLEDNNGRSAASVSDLHDLGGFWTVESASMASLIQLLKDTTKTVTCKQVAEFAQFKGAELPNEPLITNSYLSVMPKRLLEGEFEICELRASIADRRIDAKWSPINGDAPRWINIADIEQKLSIELREQLHLAKRRNEERRQYVLGRGSSISRIALAELPLHGLEGYFSARAMGTHLMLPGTPLADYFRSLYASGALVSLLSCLDVLGQNARLTDAVIAQFEYHLNETASRLAGTAKIDIAGFTEALLKMENRLATFNPWSWDRREEVER
ncbi:HD domain-containing protein [Bradyrhizobium cajani]|uniref:ATP-binding protein n=1 Tax=Bradyrhizobium cajani TaxID=1928661 RepID=A0A844TGX3_9BRAD|nr:ATP-binding protein [Bradyrhizobium cajani]MCP3371918.1 ATP-binding protein [Bradyrhizobium cajani]MVT74281.1 ATP-binding protein [Bradyrhizobium cajani]